VPMTTQTPPHMRGGLRFAVVESPWLVWSPLQLSIDFDLLTRREVLPANEQ